MAKQAVWIGIAIGVFIAGLGIGYAVFSANQSVNFMQMTPKQMQQMMSNPQIMTQWHQTMMSNPQMMNNWMNTMMSNPQSMQQIHDIMMSNPQHMQTMMNAIGPTMMNSMMNNSQMSQQMVGMMMQNQQFMHRMMTNSQFQQNWMGPWISNSTNWQGMMGSGWMNQGMMKNKMMGPMMMGTPITKESDILKTIDKIEDLLNQVSIKYHDGDSSGALSTATEAYLENYEYIEGTVAAKDQHLMEKVELMLRQDLRHAINTDQPAEKIDSKIDSIKQELGNIRNLFQ